MEDYFNNLTYNDMKLNGKLTLGENLADLGGLKCALNAFSNDDEKKQCLISWAKTWRANIRDEYAKQMTIVDPHSLPRYRINGILPHINDFYALFEINENNKAGATAIARGRHNSIRVQEDKADNQDS